MSQWILERGLSLENVLDQPDSARGLVVYWNQDAAGVLERVRFSGLPERVDVLVSFNTASVERKRLYDQLCGEFWVSDSEKHLQTTAPFSFARNDLGRVALDRFLNYLHQNIEQIEPLSIVREWQQRFLVTHSDPSEDPNRVMSVRARPMG